jgi:hypothetical protein
LPERPSRLQKAAHRVDRSSAEASDARIRERVECTVRDQGLDLEVRDPVVLHTVAALILAVRRQGGEREDVAS